MSRDMATMNSTVMDNLFAMVVWLSWLYGSVHETVCDGETFLVEGEQWVE
jgi:hypothetical protein